MLLSGKDQNILPLLEKPLNTYGPERFAALTNGIIFGFSRV